MIGIHSNWQQSKGLKNHFFHRTDAIFIMHYIFLWSFNIWNKELCCKNNVKIKISQVFTKILLSNTLVSFNRVLNSITLWVYTRILLHLRALSYLDAIVCAYCLPHLLNNLGWTLEWRPVLLPTIAHKAPHAASKLQSRKYTLTFTVPNLANIIDSIWIYIHVAMAGLT